MHCAFFTNARKGRFTSHSVQSLVRVMSDTINDLSTIELTFHDVQPSDYG
jgi:hypothetical protein